MLILMEPGCPTASVQAVLDLLEAAGIRAQVQ
jgi:hypothetical protein